MIFSTIAAGVGAAAGAAGSAIGAGAGAGLSGAFSALGTVGGLVGQGIAYMGQQKAEKLRQLQMNLEATRAKRQVIRESVVARAQSLNAGEAQGATGSSGLAGGLGQVAGQAASNIQGISQGQQIGNGLFAANRMISTGQTIASIGGAFQDIGTQFAQNQERNYRVWGN